MRQTDRLAADMGAEEQGSLNACRLLAWRPPRLVVVPRQFFLLGYGLLVLMMSRQVNQEYLCDQVNNEQLK